MPAAAATSAPARRRSTATVWRGVAARGPVRRSRTGIVPRSALVRRLTELREPTLAVIVAPPGYGKSTLLGQWADHDQRTFVWLASDGDDDLVAALASALPAVEDDGGYVVVVDDAHLVPASALDDLLGVVMAELPAGSMIALSSRTEPPLRLGRLRADHALIEVRTQDLAMSMGEAALLLRHAGLELELAELRALECRTEGWPVGLYLAALSLREQPDTALAIARLSGDDHRFAEYFRDEVLPALSPDLLEFALQTAVLDELSGPVCDGVLERRGSAPMLARLHRTTALLQPLDPAHERYRWHGLFRDALSAELRRTAPERVQALHERASAWYQARGHVDQAIAHAAAVHDPVRTGDLLWAGIAAYVTQGRNDIVQGWLAHFNRAEVASHAPLALSAAYSSLAAGHAAEARYWAVSADAALERGSRARRPRSLLAGLAGIEAMIAQAGVDEMAQAAVRACELEYHDSPWRPFWLFMRGTSLHLTGDRDQATRLLEEAADLSAATAPSVTSLSLAQATMIAIERQEWDVAAELTDRAREVVDERGLSTYPISALAFAASAAARAHDGRADEAKRDLRRGIELLTALGDFVPWYGAEARILLAHGSLWLADVVGARSLLAEASRLARRTAGAVIFEQWFDGAWSYMDTLAESSLAGPSSLTIAELRILRFLPSHRSFREIAAQLGVSANTVKTQAHAVYRKLGAASRSEAVAHAAEAGLLGQ